MYYGWFENLSRSEFGSALSKGGEVAKPRPWEYALSTKALSKHGFTRMSRKDPKYWKAKGERQDQSCPVRDAASTAKQSRG